MRSQTVGIVEDDAAIRDSLRVLLGARGFEVRCFASAAEFLGSSGTEGLGGLVIDQQMPDLSGIELLEVLRARHIPTPVIMMTGGSDSLLEQRARKAGALVLLHKPLSTTELMTWLRVALSDSGPSLKTIQ